MDNTHQYKFLGLKLSEHLDFHIMAKAVAHSASRALGLLIANAKAFGVFLLELFLIYMALLYILSSVTELQFEGLGCFHA